MGELDELVSTLLGTFTSGIRLLRARRKRQKSSSGKTDHDNCEETLLIESFKQSRSDIREAYTRESIKSGPKFSDGDAKARSSLSTILSRLNTAFTSAVVLFSRGKVKPADQELFIKLSNKSRTEAINTLDNLSKRLSKSSSSLVSHDTVNPSKPHRRKRHRNPPPTLPTQPTALGPATKNGWIRSKPTKNDLPKSKTRTQKSTLTKSTHKEKPATSRPITLLEKQESPPKTAVENRKSGFSFASDSTKLGEIPESKMARLLAGAGAGAGAGVASHDNDSRYYPTVVAFPLAPYRAEPPKRRFGMGKLWKHRPAEKEFVYGGGSG